MALHSINNLASARVYQKLVQSPAKSCKWRRSTLSHQLCSAHQPHHTAPPSSIVSQAHLLPAVKLLPRHLHPHQLRDGSRSQ